VYLTLPDVKAYAIKRLDTYIGLADIPHLEKVLCHGHPSLIKIMFSEQVQNMCIENCMLPDSEPGLNLRIRKSTGRGFKGPPPVSLFYSFFWTTFSGSR
jgi:hypothetical protein